MRKILVLFPISLCILFTARAQLKWGANAGLNISSVTGVNVFNPKPLFTFQFSAFAKMPISKSLVIQPSIGYRRKGYGINERFYVDSPEHRVTTAYDYLQLSAPVLLRCNRNDNYKLYAGAGLFLAYLIKAKSFGYDVPLDRLSRFDVGLNFNIALTIHSRWVVSVASDFGADPNGSYTNICSGITLGYFIN